MSLFFLAVAHNITIVFYTIGGGRLVQPEGVCLEHSGQCKAIDMLEKNDADMFKRLRELEMAVWKAAGASGVVTAVLVVLLQKVIK